jgi:dihydroorotase
LNKSTFVSKENILYQCGWSPLEGQTLSASVEHTFVSGHLAYSKGSFDESKKGKRLLFNR